MNSHNVQDVVDAMQTGNKDKAAQMARQAALEIVPECHRHMIPCNTCGHRHWEQPKCAECGCGAFA